LENIIKLLREFNTARDWNKDHSPKNLVMALFGEVAELSKLMQWSTEKESYKIDREEIRAELADIFIYSLILADKYNIDDIEEMIRKKIVTNGIKYPVPFMGIKK